MVRGDDGKRPTEPFSRNRRKRIVFPPTLAEEDRHQSKVKRWEVPRGREASNAEATVLAHVTGAE